MTLLRQIEVEIANGKTKPQACREAQITAQTFYCWCLRRDRRSAGAESRGVLTKSGPIGNQLMSLLHRKIDFQAAIPA
jgi:hypothetical protein